MDVTWVLVTKVILHGSEVTEDPTTALGRTVKVQVKTENTDFLLQEQYYIKGLFGY